MAFKMKGFKPHNMYKTEKANTHKEHLALEKKGFDHSPYSKKVSWMYGGKKYSGNVIRETKDKIFARTHNNKVKTIIKGKTKRS